MLVHLCLCLAVWAPDAGILRAEITLMDTSDTFEDFVIDDLGRLWGIGESRLFMRDGTNPDAPPVLEPNAPIQEGTLSRFGDGQGLNRALFPVFNSDKILVHAGVSTPCCPTTFFQLLMIVDALVLLFSGVTGGPETVNGHLIHLEENEPGETIIEAESIQQLNDQIGPFSQSTDPVFGSSPIIRAPGPDGQSFSIMVNITDLLDGGQGFDPATDSIYDFLIKQTPDGMGGMMPDVVDENIAIKKKQRIVKLTDPLQGQLDNSIIDEILNIFEWRPLFFNLGGGTSPIYVAEVEESVNEGPPGSPKEVVAISIGSNRPGKSI